MNVAPPRPWSLSNWEQAVSNWLKRNSWPTQHKGPARVVFYYNSPMTTGPLDYPFVDSMVGVGARSHGTVGSLLLSPIDG
ncbi:hypothetical protein J6590_054746 [Homalodisca vitripennis]|nr:hypothetical protein J6590_054746 [Homalodisca vitripennis]